MNTKFDKDLKLMETDPGEGTMILRERKAELERIERQGRSCKTGSASNASPKNTTDSNANTTPSTPWSKT